MPTNTGQAVVNRTPSWIVSFLPRPPVNFLIARRGSGHGASDKISQLIEVLIMRHRHNIFPKTREKDA